MLAGMLLVLAGRCSWGTFQLLLLVRLSTASKGSVGISRSCTSNLPKVFPVHVQVVRHPRDASILGFAISHASTAELADTAAGVLHLLRSTPWRPRIVARNRRGDRQAGAGTRAEHRPRGGDRPLARLRVGGAR